MWNLFSLEAGESISKAKALILLSPCASIKQFAIFYKMSTECLVLLGNKLNITYDTKKIYYNLEYINVSWQQPLRMPGTTSENRDISVTHLFWLYAYTETDEILQWKQVSKKVLAKLFSLMHVDLLVVNAEFLVVTGTCHWNIYFPFQITEFRQLNDKL